MTWIRTIHEDDAKGELAATYSRILERRGKVSDIMRAQSLAPPAMEAHLDLYMRLLFGKGGLSRAERELVAVIVSVENECDYCTMHHAAALEAWWKDPDRVERLCSDSEAAELSPREAALAEYARRLTRSPAAVAKRDLDPLRAAGLEDDEILQANMITAYFNFVNRIAEGLGVEASPEEVGGYRY